MTTHWIPETEYSIHPAIDRLIVGQTSTMNHLKEMITMVGESGAPVMIQGETGVGKELVAEAVHIASGRKGQLIAVNCAAIPSELLESELFGHEKGAFTGAAARRTGRFEMADGGTIFLDEIGDMPLELQAKLLRVLESRKIQRVGGGEEIPVDFRLVTATHQNLDEYVAAGKFRADLYFRINVFPLSVPRLADRKADIPLILDRLIEAHLKSSPRANAPHFSPDAIRALSRHDWPGNVRELRNVLERAMVFFAGKVVTAENVLNNLLSMSLPKEPNAMAVEPIAAALDSLPNPESFRALPSDTEVDLRRYLRDIEAVMIEAALTKFDGCVSHAADALRLQRTTLVEKMKKFGIQRTDVTAD